MSPIRNQLLEIIDYMPMREQILLLEIAQRFVPDDIATPDDLAAIKAARAEYQNGETISHEDINWN